MNTRLLSACLVLGLVLAACAGDGVDMSGNSSAPTSTVATSTNATTTTSAPSTTIADQPDVTVGSPTDTTVVTPAPGTTAPGTTAPPSTTIPVTNVPGVPVVRGTVFISEAQVSLAESFPVQVFVAVVGDKPTPCHGLDWEVSAADGVVNIDLFSIDDGSICIQVLDPFEINIAAGSFSDGDWVVVLNGEQIGEFTP